MKMPAVDPLSRAAAIADSNGFPSQFFIRQWNNLLSLPALGTSGGVSTTLDVLGSTQGQLLYRSATAWTALNPTTTGFILRTNGAAANPSWSSLSTILDLIGSTRGSVIYRGASGWAIRVPNTSGFVLTDQGVGADPVYAAPVTDVSGSDLDDLADVDTTGVADGDVLTYDSGSGDWIAAAPTGGSTLPASYWNENDRRYQNFFIHRDLLRLSNLYNGGSTDGMIRSSSSKSSGHYYFEILIHDVGTTHFPISGVATSAHTLLNFLGNDATAGRGYGMGCGGSSWTGASASSGLSTYVAGDVLGVEVDFTASTGFVKFYKNNTLNKTYGSLTLGTMFAATSCRGSDTQQSCSLRTTAAQCTYSPPAGASNWD